MPQLPWAMCSQEEMGLITTCKTQQVSGTHCLL